MQIGLSRILSMAAVLAIGIGLGFSCGSDDGEESADPSDNPAGSTSEGGTDTPGGTDGAVGAGEILLESGLNVVYPKDLAVTSPVGPVSEQLTRAGVIGIDATDAANLQGPPRAEDYVTKRDRYLAVLTADSPAACAAAVPEEFNLSQGGLGSVPCFGPSFSWQSHPDGVGDEPASGNGDSGIFWPYESPEATSGAACGASRITALIDTAGDYADTALGLQAMVLCGARLGGLELPAAGEAVDLASSLADIQTGDHFTVSTASVARAAADGANGQAIYTTTVTGTLTDVPRSITTPFTVSVQHSPNEDNSSYQGTLQFLIDNFSGDNSGAGAVSIAYSWGDNNLRYRYRQVTGPDVAADIAFSATTRELAADGSEAAPNYQEINVDVDQYGLGKVASVWRTIHLLVMNGETKTDGTGVVYFGHRDATTAVGAADFATIQGFACYPKFPPPMGAATFADKVQQQVLQLNTTSGAFEPLESYITYAPTASCDWNDSNDPSQAASFSVQSDSGSENLAFPITNNLPDINVYSSAWTAPRAPLLQ